jgi:hypothetical protein
MSFIMVLCRNLFPGRGKCRWITELFDRSVMILGRIFTRVEGGHARDAWLLGLASM